MPPPAARWASAIAALAVSTPAGAQVVWTHFGADQARVPIARANLLTPPTPAWVCTRDESDRAVTWIAESGVVAAREVVLAVGWVLVGGQRDHRVFAVDRWSGRVRWSASVPTPYLESWSTPAVDLEHHAVVVASGMFVTAYDLGDGGVRWRIALDRPVVNASPLVTSDRGPRDRALITDYDGFGVGGALACINIDERHGIANPFDPGEVVWTAPIGGSSGNSPACARGVVFVASVGEAFTAPGRVRALDLLTGSEIWNVENPGFEGFYGGVSYAERARERSVYAASYGFFGGMNSGQVLKIGAATGGIAWWAPCNRTASTPIPLADGRVVVSTGLQGYGSAPSVRCYADAGASAALLWDSALNTWTDFDHDGVIDPGEFLALGGWTQLPAVAASDGSWVMLVGTPTNIPGGAAAALNGVDLSRAPTEPGFVAWNLPAGGGTPAIAGATVSSIGADGLRAFGPSPPRADVDADGDADTDDLYAWESGFGARDVNSDGTIDAADRDALVGSLRAAEAGAILRGWL